MLMTGNELFEPLRGVARVAPRRLPRFAGSIVACAGLVCLGMVSGLFEAPGRGGEPEVVGTIERAVAAPDPVVVSAVQPVSAPASPLASADSPPPGDVRQPGQLVGQSVEIQNGVKIYRPIMTGAAGVTMIKVPPGAADASAVRSPAPAPAPIPDNAPQVAVLFGGLGFDRAATGRAAVTLPAAVTFGFTPYGDGLGAQVQMARNAGHEIVLQLPMEGLGKTESPPAHMLTTDPARTPADLAWLLDRFKGYAGVSNLLGGRVLANEAALRPIAQAVAARRSFFLEDGGATPSALDSVGREVGLRSAKADVVLDARAGAVALAQDFQRLEDLARSRGSAIGTVIAGPGTAEALAQLLARLPDRGLALVSLSQAIGSKRATAPAGLALSR